MNNTNYHTFSAVLDIIGVNPFVFVPETILQVIFKQANKTSGPIPRSRATLVT
jgi:hypothetical protein